MNALSTLKEGEIRENEFRVWNGNSFRWFRSKDSIFRITNEEVNQIIGIAEDVTYEKMLQDKLRNEQRPIG